MPVDLPASIETAIGHLREGALQAADDLLTNSLNDYRQQLRDIGLGPPVLPKGKLELTIEFMKRVTAKLGNPDDLTALITEIEKVE